jgi:hypothetical protein
LHPHSTLHPLKQLVPWLAEVYQVRFTSSAKKVVEKTQQKWQKGDVFNYYKHNN